MAVRFLVFITRLHSPEIYGISIKLEAQGLIQDHWDQKSGQKNPDERLRPFSRCPVDDEGGGEKQDDAREGGRAFSDFGQEKAGEEEPRNET